VSLAKLDLAAKGLGARARNLLALMIGRSRKLSVQSCSKATLRERHEFVSMSFNFVLYSMDGRENAVI